MKTLDTRLDCIEFNEPAIKTALRILQDVTNPTVANNSLTLYLLFCLSGYHKMIGEKEPQIKVSGNHVNTIDELKATQFYSELNNIDKQQFELPTSNFPAPISIDYLRNILKIIRKS